MCLFQCYIGWFHNINVFFPQRWLFLLGAEILTGHGFGGQLCKFTNSQKKKCVYKALIAKRKQGLRIP